MQESRSESGLNSQSRWAAIRSGAWRQPGDIAAGLTLAIAAVPDGMASALVAGVAPAYGLYAVIAGGAVGSLLTSTAMMSIGATAALSVSAGQAIVGFSGEQRVAALAMLAILTGGFQLLLGALNLGFLTRFISNAVMTGFLAGVGVSIVLSQLSDFTGYEASGRSTIAEVRDLLAHLDQIDPRTTLIGLATVVAILLVGSTPLARLANLIGVAVGTAAALMLGWREVAVVATMGQIPRSLPAPAVPDLSLAPNLLGSAVALGAIGLVQAAGVSQRYTNPDGTRGDPSRDFVAQGAANVASGLIRGLPIGGSISSTALAVASGAVSRWANVWMAVFVLLGLLILADVLATVPLTSLAALMILAGLGSLQPAAIAGVLRTSRRAAAIMIVTFAAVLLLGITEAVMVGFALSVLSFVWESAASIRVVQLVTLEDGRTAETEPPAHLPEGSVTVLDFIGDPFFAAAYEVEEHLPDPRGSAGGAVVLRLRDQGGAGSTFLTVLANYQQRLQANDARLFLSGVGPELMAQLERTGLLDQLGADAVFPAETAIGASTRAAREAAQRWVGRQTAHHH